MLHFRLGLLGAFSASSYTLPRPVRSQIRPLGAVDIDPGTVIGAVAVAGAAVAFAAQSDEVEAASASGPPSKASPVFSFGRKQRAKEVSVPAWSGDAYRTARWPKPPPPPPVRPEAPTMERVGWSGDVFASATREALRAAELEVAAARLAERRDRISKLGVRRAAPPAMPREAWSGPPFSSPARVTLPSESFFDQFFNFFSKPAQNAPAAPTPAVPPSNGAWRSTCDASGVVSLYDFGVRLGG